MRRHAPGGVSFRSVRRSGTLASGSQPAIESSIISQPNFTAAQLAAIRVPTAIADGAHEEAIKREHTEYLARTIPGATLIILPDVSHFGALQNPSELATAVLGFLR